MNISIVHLKYLSHLPSATQGYLSALNLWLHLDDSTQKKNLNKTPLAAQALSPVEKMGNITNPNGEWQF